MKHTKIYDLQDQEITKMSSALKAEAWSVPSQTLHKREVFH